MMNRIYRWPVLCLLCAGVYTACVDDKGNYDYRPADEILPIKVTGLPEDTTFLKWSEAALHPVIADMPGSESDYDFLWYSFTPNASGYVPKRDTVGREKNLLFTVTNPVGEKQTLVFQITDKNTGIAVTTKLSYTSTSEYSYGWFVLKDENDKTDVDLVKPDGTLLENLIYGANQEKMDGKAVQMVYQSSYYCHEFRQPDGSVTVASNLKTFHVLSEREYFSLNPEDMKIYKRFDDQFFVSPENRKIQCIAEEYGDLFLMNDSQIHTIYGMGLNTGRYTFAKHNYPDLYPGFISVPGMSNVVSYSQGSGTFCYTDTWLASVTPVTDGIPSGEEPFLSAHNLDAQMLWLGQRTADWGGSEGVTLLKSTTLPDVYVIAELYVNGADYPIISFDTLDYNKRKALIEADVRGCNNLNSIWFSKGNVLSYYTFNGYDSNSDMGEAYRFPEGETVSFIRQIESGYGHPSPYNHLLILTNSTSGWKLYRFKMVGDGLSPVVDGDPLEMHTGKGAARWAMLQE